VNQSHSEAGNHAGIAVALLGRMTELMQSPMRVLDKAALEMRIGLNSSIDERQTSVIDN
jgi:hypothetical protein